MKRINFLLTVIFILMSAACMPTHTDSLIQLVQGQVPDQDNPASYNLASLVSFNQQKSRYEVFCSAALIAERRLLTAAHCFERSGGGDFYVSFSEIEEVRAQPESTLFPILNYGIHPRFSSHLLPNFDIAWIEIQKPNNETLRELLKNYRPLKLLKDPSWVNKNTDPLVIGGFGMESPSFFDKEWGHRRFIEADMTHFVQTNFLLGLLWIKPLQKSLQVQSYVCFGDSGGPLYWRSDDGEWYIAGIAHGIVGQVLPSQSKPCDPTFTDIFYTYVAAYEDWLEVTSRAAVQDVQEQQLFELENVEEIQDESGFIEACLHTQVQHKIWPAVFTFLNLFQEKSETNYLGSKNIFSNCNYANELISKAQKINIAGPYFKEHKHLAKILIKNNLRQLTLRQISEPIELGMLLDGFKDLNELIMSDIQTAPSDLEWLTQSLVHLDSIELSRVKLLKKKALNSFPNVKNLALRGRECDNLIKVIPWSQLSKLLKLTVSNCDLVDISWLSSLKEHANLEELDLSRNQIEDISIIEGWSSLKKLNLYKNRVKDLTPLQSIQTIEQIKL